MSNLTINNWNKKKKRLQQNFLELADDDLTYIKGREGELVDHVQKKLRISREEAKKIIRLY